MGRLHKVLILTGVIATLATLTTPGIALAQPGERAATQLFMAPTGRALPKGQGYFKGLAFSVPFVQGGVTDRFSIGIGMPLFALGEGLVVSPKIQVQRSEKHSTSIGLVEFLDTQGSFGIAYVAHTVELKAGAVHVAVFKPLSAYAAASDVALMVGAERRLNNRVTFMTENYLFGGGHPILSGGVRIRAPHTTWDLGWLAPIGFEYGTPGAPMISVGWKF